MLNILEPDVLILCQSATRSSSNEFAQSPSSSIGEFGNLSLYQLDSGKKVITICGFHPMHAMRYAAGEGAVVERIREAALRFSFLQAVSTCHVAAIVILKRGRSPRSASRWRIIRPSTSLANTLTHPLKNDIFTISFRPCLTAWSNGVIPRSCGSSGSTRYWRRLFADCCSTVAGWLICKLLPTLRWQKWLWHGLRLVPSHKDSSQ
jgi:hypothetical protein